MIIQYPGLVYTLTAAWDNSPSLVYTLTPAWDNSFHLVYTLTSSLVYSAVPGVNPKWGTGLTKKD